MVNLSTFQQYLTTDAPLSQPLPKSFNSDEQHLRKWAALLPLQTETQQIEQLEQVLTELRTANIDDRQRLTLFNIVLDAANQLIALLRCCASIISMRRRLSTLISWIMWHK